MGSVKKVENREEIIQPACTDRIKNSKELSQPVAPADLI
jgi:hypothetical protein